MPYSETPTFRLRVRASGYALALTEARFDDAYAFTSPSFREVCGSKQWSVGLISEASLIRASNGLHEDVPLVWKVELVEPMDDAGTALVSIKTIGRGVGLRTWSWRRIDDQ